MTIITNRCGLRILNDPTDMSKGESEVKISRMTDEDIKKYGPIVGRGKRPVRLATGMEIQKRTKKPEDIVRKKMLTKELLTAELKTKSPQQIAKEYGYLVNAVRALKSRWKVG